MRPLTARCLGLLPALVGAALCGAACDPDTDGTRPLDPTCAEPVPRHEHRLRPSDTPVCQSPRLPPAWEITNSNFLEVDGWVGDMEVAAQMSWTYGQDFSHGTTWLRLTNCGNRENHTFIWARVPEGGTGGGGLG